MIKQARLTLLLTAPLIAGLAAAPPARADDNSGNNNNDRVFYLTGTATHDCDPENPKNEVIRLTSVYDTAHPERAQHGAIARVFRKGVKVWDLDNQLEVKAWFREPHSCGIGSPRMVLAIDVDGDGRSDGNAFGYVGTSPSFTACPMRTWIYEDFTGGDTITGPGPGTSTPTTAPDDRAEPGGPPNEELEWDLTQFGGPFYNTWSQVEAFFAAHPRHRVCAARYVEDFGAPPGTSYADIITMGDATWNGFRDTAGRADPFARDPCKFHGDENRDDSSVRRPACKANDDGD
jgi:hypothetical protein